MFDIIGLTYLQVYEGRSVIKVRTLRPHCSAAARRTVWSLHGVKSAV